MADWEHIFREQGKVFTEPVARMPDAIDMMRELDVHTVLDLGCGTGRHSVELAKAGFDLHAADVSPEALRQTQECLGQQGLRAAYHQFSCYEQFPFADDFFDAVVSTQVIHHNYIGKVRYCISEIERVLRPGGFVFISVSARKSHKHRSAPTNPEPRTYLPTEGREKGLPHYIYNIALLRKDFSNFRIHLLEKENGIYYNLFGTLR
ncbi:class I SAM-dependent methyltransferase [Candidatus Woesearchaeota archaeon]|nr:class I SAM-dependent methyltransferase [Candidatus Woesearchaeota archaeon]